MISILPLSLSYFAGSPIILIIDWSFYSGIYSEISELARVFSIIFIPLNDNQCGEESRNGVDVALRIRETSFLDCD